MLSLLLNEANIWFSCGLGAVLTLLTLEITGMLFGVSLLSIVAEQATTDRHSDTASGRTLATWLALDRLPFLVWLMLLVTSFGITGLVLNFLSLHFLATYVNPWPVIALALLIAVVITAQCGGLIARWLPEQPTATLPIEHLVGTVGCITSGVARPRSPAQAKFTDCSGQAHYLLVEPMENNEQFSQGEQVLLLKKQAQSWLVTRYIAPE
ncbi:OB-fold-containig protein [Alteromonas gilva]|uniref:DUF1449 family protein n=1 Tax=Alteromonas gilva TaxID=2987522 RepID=A0ABT5KXG3_9ALTE|nr:OB-fold-containig protein [Alteromonas gilva]MDC8829322.1 DUF1449 family protein [Alteromonas gilva]